MLIAYARTLLSIYFFVPLGLGLITMSFAPPFGRSASQAAWFPLIMVGLGLLGALEGVPYWTRQIKQDRADTQHFETRCKSAGVLAPTEPMRDVGIVWRHPDAARSSFLTAADNWQDMVDVGSGGYGELESIDEKGIAHSTRWRPGNSPEVYDHASARIPAPTLRYELFTEGLTDEEDKVHAVEGARTTIVDRTNGALVARRVVYAKRARSQSPWSHPGRVCPSDAMASEKCSSNGCTAINFVMSAVRPVAPSDHQGAFHLYRGVGERKTYCSFVIKFGPGINPEDVEWWAVAGGALSRELHLRLRGTSDHVWCESFFTPATVTSDLRFFEGRRSYPADALRQQKSFGSQDAPHQLASTLLSSPAPSPTQSR